MFNAEQYNENTYWSWPAPLEAVQDDIVFNWFSLLSLCNNPTWIAIQTENSRDLAEISLSTFSFWQDSWWWVLNRKYTNRTLDITLTFIENTYDELVLSIDNFKRNTRGIEWKLEIKDGWILRTAKATIINFKPWSIKKSNKFTSDVPATFEILDPNWTIEPAITNTFETITWDLIEEITNNWSTETFWKYFFFFKTGIVSLTQVIVKVNWVPTTINETISDNDTLIIDMINKEVKLNNIEVDFDWFMQELEVWSNIVTFEFNWWSTVNLDISTLHNNILL